MCMHLRFSSCTNTLFSMRYSLNFFRAVVSDRNDHLAQFHLALQLAILRQVSPQNQTHVNSRKLQ